MQTVLRCALVLTTILSAASTGFADYFRGPASIDITSDGRYAVVAFRRDQAFTVVDLTERPFTMRDVTRADGFPQCPLKVRCFDNTACLVSDLGGELVVVDVPEARIVRRVPVPLYCQDVIWDAKRSRYYVSNQYQDRLLVFDTDWQEIGSIKVGRRPAAMTLGPHGRLWVGNHGTFDVSVVDLDRQSEIRRVYLGSRPEDLDSTATAVLVTNHGGAELDRVNGVPVIRDDQVDIRNIVTAIDPRTFARDELFENLGADYAGIDVGFGAVAFTAQGSGTVHVYRDAAPASTLRTIDFLADSDLPGKRRPDGRRVYANVRDVALRSASQMFAISFMRDTLVEYHATEDGNWRVHGETALNELGKPLLAYESDEPSLSPRQLGQLHILTLSGWDGGQKDFTCFTCHSGWHSDFRLFVDGRPDPHDADGSLQGVERHPSLRFMSRYAPFGWEGEDHELVDFNHATIERHARFAGDARPDREIAEQLSLAMHILTPGPNPHAGKMDDTRGRELFEGKAGCATCHPAPAFTDQQLHDVGTGRRLDTPSLRGSWDLVHYLHDARAATLEEVLDPATYDKGSEATHGNLTALTPEERIEVAAYVRGLGDKQVFRGGSGAARAAARIRKAKARRAAAAEPAAAQPATAEHAAAEPATAEHAAAEPAAATPAAAKPAAVGGETEVKNEPAETLSPSTSKGSAVELVARDRIPQLIRSLSSPDSAERLRAARAFRRVEREPWQHMAFVDGVLTDTGPDPTAAVPALIRCLDDANVAVRAEAAGALGLFGRASSAAVPHLVTALDAHQPLSLRTAAAVALGKIGPHSADASRALLEILRQPQAPVALLEAAAVAIGRIHRGAEAAVPDLKRFLENDERAEVRRLAAVALGKIGPVAAPAMPALTAALSDESAAVRDMAVFALGRIREEAWVSIPALVVALEDDELQVRRRAARTLGFLYEQSAPAIEALARSLRDDAGARNEAGWALGRIGAEAIPTLDRMLEETEDDSIRLTVKRALAAASSDHRP